jgi:DNA-binding MarR family transcriptional regulator
MHEQGLFLNLRSAQDLSEDKVKRDFDSVLADETIRSLNEKLSDSTFKSSTRILILVLLAFTRKMSSVELRTLTGLGKGSLENHLSKLESYGYVTMSNVKSIGARGAPRQTVEITKKGIDECRALVDSLSSLDL